MIIWFISLAWATLMIFGGRVDGSPSAMHKKQDQAPAYFPSTWQINNNNFPGAAIPLDQNFTLSYTVTGIAPQSPPTLALLWTNAPSSSTPNSSNTWEVTNVTYYCSASTAGNCAFDNGATGGAILNLGVDPSQALPQSGGSVNNFFLCFATGVDASNHALTCESYSPFFNVAVGDVGSASIPGASVARLVADATPAATSLVIPTALISVTLNTAFVTPSGLVLPASSQSSGQAITSSPTASPAFFTISNTPTATTTIIPLASSSVSTPSHNSKGLSTGALVGIIVGAVGGALIIALLGLLCLRRRKNSRSKERSNTVDSHGSQPEHVLLTQPYSTFSSRDLIAEKDSPTTLASILETPLGRPSLPQNPRHSYDSLNASAPYSGLAAAAPKRRQQPPSTPPPVSQNAHQQSLLSRGISDASGPLTRGLSDASGPISLHSTVRGEGEEAEDFEEYHDVPIYGDARHTPTLYESHPSLAQAPFLGEEGMSAEEIARLEEEERRIDAAIAEAEGR